MSLPLLAISASSAVRRCFRTESDGKPFVSESSPAPAPLSPPVLCSLLPHHTSLLAVMPPPRDEAPEAMVVPVVPA